MVFDARTWVLLAGLCACAHGRGWSWPDSAESVRIDTKVRFVDDSPTDKSVVSTVDINRRGKVHLDEGPFHEHFDPERFLNKPQPAARLPLQVEGSNSAYRVIGQQGVYPVQTTKHRNNDGTLDSVQFCKCVSTPECNPRYDSERQCGSGKFLCCYKQPNKNQLQNTEFFNEIDDERPMLFPGHENLGGPFPHPNSELNGFGPGHNHDSSFLGAVDDRREHNVDQIFPERPVLVGPSGPTGHIGPKRQNKQVLVGPEGPTGIIGPAPIQNQNTDASAQRGVLVGPGGPTGVIGPYNNRPVLVGPSGPSGIIGPGRVGNRGTLVGPRGPTGVIGPGYRGYRNQNTPGILVGPGGPTGIIGPGRQLLVGPGGPTGHIGPRYYGK